MKKVFVTLVGIMCVSLFMAAGTAFATDVEHKKSSFVEALSEHVSVSGLLEVEAGFESSDDEDSSDVELATVELEIEAEVADWIKGRVLFLWEEGDDSEIELDEGVITIGNTETMPVYLSAGKMYLPFGRYETNMISDPLTLNLGETNDTAVQIGFEQFGLYGSVYAFNGEVSEHSRNGNELKEEDDEITCFGANLGYALKNDNMTLDVGVGWINNIAEAEELRHGFEIEIPGIGNIPFRFLKDYVGGFAAHAIASFGPVSVIGEYVCAIDDPEAYEVALDTITGNITNALYEVDAPSAWNAEIAYTFEAMNLETTVGVGYQGTDNCEIFEDLPESKILGVVGVGFGEHLDVSLEYAHAEMYDTKDQSGRDVDGEDHDVVTLQLALEF